jgi:hypothetical protein
MYRFKRCLHCSDKSLHRRNSHDKICTARSERQKDEESKERDSEKRNIAEKKRKRKEKKT